MMPTFRDLQKCCEREAAKRRYVYPRLVETEKMTPAKAEREISMMDVAAEHFKGLADVEDKEGRLI
jgi:hypothetical protein